MLNPSGRAQHAINTTTTRTIGCSCCADGHLHVDLFLVELQSHAQHQGPSTPVAWGAGSQNQPKWLACASLQHVRCLFAFYVVPSHLSKRVAILQRRFDVHIVDRIRKCLLTACFACCCFVCIPIVSLTVTRIYVLMILQTKKETIIVVGVVSSRIWRPHKLGWRPRCSRPCVLLLYFLCCCLLSC